MRKSGGTGSLFRFECALEPAGLYSTTGYYILSDFYLGETKVLKSISGILHWTAC